MSDNKVKGVEYKFSKLDALAQFHIVRRLAPIVGELLAAVGPNVSKSGNMSMSEEDMTKALVPIAEALSKLSDSDSEYVIFNLLKGVEMQQTGGGWSKVITQSGDKHVFMFENIKNDMQVMLTLAGKSLMANLSGFINALPMALKEGALTQQA